MKKSFNLVKSQNFKNIIVPKYLS